MPPSFRRLGAPFPIFTAQASTGRIEGPRPFQSQRIKMFDIIELNGKKVAELREIATKLGIARVDKLKKQDLVYSILDEQAARPNPKGSTQKSEGASNSRSGRSRKSNNSKATSDDSSPNREAKASSKTPSDKGANDDKKAKVDSPNDDSKESDSTLSLIHI